MHKTLSFISLNDISSTHCVPGTCDTKTISYRLRAFTECLLCAGNTELGAGDEEKQGALHFSIGFFPTHLKSAYCVYPCKEYLLCAGH